MTLLFRHRLQQILQRNLTRTFRRFESSSKPPHAKRASKYDEPPNTTIPGPSWAWIDPTLIVKKPLKGYNRMQKRSPILTQIEASLVIYYLGDFAAQTLGTNVFVDGDYDAMRGLRAMLVGGLVSIPSYRWFLFLGNNFNYKSLGHWGSIAVKIVVSQSIFTPLFNTYFFGAHSLLAGGSWEDAKRRVWETVPTSCINSLKVWPAVTAFSFTFIRPVNRSVFAGVISIFWQMYLLWLNQKSADADGERKKQLGPHDSAETKKGKAKKAQQAQQTIEAS